MMANKKFISNRSEEDPLEKYIKVMKINKDDLSDLILAFNNDDIDIFFDDLSGSIKIVNPITDDVTIILNSLTRKNVSPNSSLINRENDKIYYSTPTGKWILYHKDNENMYILYNPIPRQSFISEYNRDNLKTTRILKQNCKLTEIEGKDINLDPYCYCINDDNFCVHNIFRKDPSVLDYIKENNPVEYEKIVKSCHCISSSCPSQHQLLNTSMFNRCNNTVGLNICGKSYNISPTQKLDEYDLIKTCQKFQVQQRQDCVLGPPNEADWSVCSKDCGGTQSTNRTIITPAKGGGLCPPLGQSLTVTRSCNKSENCTQIPKDCVLGEPKEADWSICSEECGGTQTATRPITTEKSGGGLCPPPGQSFTITRSCNKSENCNSDCVLGEPQEADWSECNADCGGTQVAYKKIIREKIGNGKCPPDGETIIKTRKCNKLNTCDKPVPVDCVLGNPKETDWSRCSVDCGGGVQEADRPVLVREKDGGKCPSDGEQIKITRSCNNKPCETSSNDCVLGDPKETDWSRCSAECGGGVQEADRPILESKKDGGKCPPDGETMKITRECNKQECGVLSTNKNIVIGGIGITIGLILIILLVLYFWKNK